MPPRSQISRAKPTRKVPIASQLLEQVAPTAQPQQTASQPISNACGVHRSLRKGLLSASELGLEELVNENEDPYDLVSVIRFPPAIAAILRARLSECFRQSLEGWREGVFPSISPRGHLGLTITPTSKEDYRLFEVHLDIMEEAEISLIKRWRPDFEVEKYPPLAPKTPTKGIGGVGAKQERGPKAKAKGKARPGSAGSSVVMENNTSSLVDNVKMEEGSTGTPIATVQLWGLLTELPTLIEAYKSLDMETMIKSANISQLLVVYFAEDETRVLPTPVVNNSGELHHCCEKVQAELEGVECPAETLLTDITKLRAPKCPWLYPSGITAPSVMHLERRVRDMDLFTKAEIQTAELDMMTILKPGRHEVTSIEVASALEGFMQQEALQKESTIHPREAIIHPTAESKITYVVPENPTNIFDNPGSDFSDEMFEDEPTKDDRQLFEGDSAAVARRRRDRRQGPTAIATKGAVGHGQQAVHASLEEEFIELAQMQARQAVQDMEADFEAEFSYGTGLMADNAALAGDEDVSDHITSMKKIDPELIKKKRKKKKNTDETIPEISEAPPG